MSNEQIMKLALKKLQSKAIQMTSEMGSIAQNHFIMSFKNQGFVDSTFEHWKPRKRDERKDRGKPLRAILVKSGRLRRSIRRVRTGLMSVSIVSDVPYAKIHNEGLVGRAYGKHPFKMPKRQFIGDSKAMRSRIEKMIDRHMKNL